MRNFFKIFTFAAIIFACTNSAAFAESMYPATLENGNLILVDGGMGVGRYAVKNSVDVAEYAPPFYQLLIDVVSVNFSDEYVRQNGTYVGGPYKIGDSFTMAFRYNWDTKTVFTKNNEGIWKNWDINRHYSHAEGNPLIPNTAEVAFFAAYNMKFFGNMRNSEGYSVISENLYDAL